VISLASPRDDGDKQTMNKDRIAARGPRLDPEIEALILKSTRRNLRTHLSNNHVEEMLRRIMAHLADSARYIALTMQLVRRTMAGGKNVHDDAQMKLDVVADAILKKRLEQETAFDIRQFASEEQDRILLLKNSRGPYSVTVDPLDGSSLIDVNLAVGTIVGIYKGAILNGRPARRNLVAAMCIVYGPLTTLLYTAGRGTHEFVLDPTGNFVLSNEKIKLRVSGEIYSPGGLARAWPANHARFIGELEERGYKLRYSGGLVPDFNQILLKRGGIFSYPALADAPQGKMRLLFEALPLALLIEQAGGRATDGRRDILEIVAKDIKDRTPLYIGSVREIDMARGFLTSDRRGTNE
jgi:fructose-1,6-bisphosphatase I